MNKPETIENIIIVKLGGAEGVNAGAVCADVASLKQAGLNLALVHGGSADTNSLSQALQHPPRFITSPSGYSSRYSDRRTIEIFAMAVNGKLNTLLVEQLQALGVNVLGICGLDGRLMVADRKAAIQSLENGKRKIICDDYTGKIKSVNATLLYTLLSADYTPVIAPLAISTEGVALNVDADRAAAMIAAALHSRVLILLTAVSGLMRVFPDEHTIIDSLSQTQLDQALQYAEGRMKKKILSAQEALRAGIQKVIIADGRQGQPITRALAGKGTVIQ